MKTRVELLAILLILTTGAASAIAGLDLDRSYGELWHFAIAAGAAMILVLVKLLDPILLIAAVGAWFWGRTWIGIIAVCVTAAVAQELLLFFDQQHTRTFRPLMLIVSFPAALVWAFAALAVRKLVARIKRAH